MENDLAKDTLAYHARPPAGKIGVVMTKSCETQRDLSLAYTPGVAEPVRKIAKDPEAAYQYTAKGNLVAVITDGSAVLGLGNVGALASKPVMEGKSVLFKKFADIDVFDIEVDAKSADDFINTVVAISPTFGGINLEDIAAPHCFYIEKALKARLNIPVFHDDQHGTAIIVAAGLLSALKIQKKSIEDATIVVIGAGAAGIASLNLLKAIGMPAKHITLVDRQGVIHTGRKNLNEFKQKFAKDTECRTLADALLGTDILLGVSGPNLVSADMVASMADRPVVFALSNPDPEISPAVAKAVRDDLIIATGRSDYPNQVNNVLGFPFIFRGALDVRATTVNQQMAIAAVHALCRLAEEPIPQEVLAVYGLSELQFGSEYIIPKPIDARLRKRVSAAVAKAAIESGVAQRDYPYEF
ncbi:MAG: malate dehydrogenase [Gammaproteobacteria bacterium]|nr:malate dehydrogenase [Gammaproteobacteria bacterium]